VVLIEEQSEGRVQQLLISTRLMENQIKELLAENEALKK